MSFFHWCALIVTLCYFQPGKCALGTVEVTAPTVIWNENDVDLICTFDGLDNANLTRVTWYSPTQTTQVYFYNASTNTALGSLTGRATGVLGTSKFTITITNATIAVDDDTTYYCTVEDGASANATGQVTLNVAVLCDPSPCENGATCVVETTSSYSCSCPTNFTGVNCEIDLTNLTTETATTDQTSQQDTSTTGVESSTEVSVVDECASNPCQNGGNCTDLVGDYLCTCPACWAGSKSCETQAINECDSNPCQNNGTCIDGCFQFTCNCPFGFGGNNCETSCDNIQAITPIQTVLLGSSVTLACTAAAGATYKWSTSADGSDPIGTSSSYTIPLARKDESSNMYYCFATLNGCTNRNATKVITTYDVAFNGTSFTNYTLEEGESLELEGELEANPEALLYWQFTGLPETTTDGNDTVEVTPDTVNLNNKTYNSSSYLIVKAKKSDAGNYRCFGELPGNVKYLVKDVWVSVGGDDADDNGSGLKGWQIALIVIGVLLLIAILIIIIVFVVLKKKSGSVEPDEEKNKQHYSSNGNDESLSKSLSGFRSPRKSAKYEKIENEREKGKDEAYHSDMEMKPKKKKKRLLNRKTNIDGDQEEGDVDNEGGTHAPRPLPDYPTGRGRTLPPLNMEEEKAKTKKKKKKRVTEEEEEQQSEESGRE